MDDLQHLRESLSQSLNRARERTEGAKSGKPGRKSPPHRANPIARRCSQSATIFELAEEQERICKRLLGLIEKEQVQQQEIERRTEVERLRVATLSEESEIAHASLRLVRRRLADLERRATREEAALQGVLKERRVAAAELVETEAVCERIAHRLRSEREGSTAL